MYIVAKFSIWRRYQVPEEHEQVILEKLKRGVHPDDIEEIEGEDSEMLNDCETRMLPEENSGFSTIEVRKEPATVSDEEPDLIWENGII